MVVMINDTVVRSTRKRLHGDSSARFRGGNRNGTNRCRPFFILAMVDRVVTVLVVFSIIIVQNGLVLVPAAVIEQDDLVHAGKSSSTTTTNGYKWDHINENTTFGSNSHSSINYDDDDGNDKNHYNYLIGTGIYDM